MSQLVIRDIELYEDLSNQVHIHGGFRFLRHGLNPDLAADLDADLAAELTVEGSVSSGRISVFARGSGAAAAASASTTNGRASARAFAQA